MMSAIVLAAGQSRRMGKPKINLPWGGTTVLGQVISTLLQAGLEEIIVVTGMHRVEGLPALPQEVRFVLNPDPSGEMLSSFQVGLQAASAQAEAALLALADQPQMELAVARALLDEYEERHPSLLIPSYHMRRGHPWLVRRSLWDEITALPESATLRDFLNAHAPEIAYLPVERESVLQDLDTPADYEKYRPQGEAQG